MSQTPNSKIRPNNENSENKSTNGIQNEFFGRNRQRLLERLNNKRLYTDISVKQKSFEKTDKIKIKKSIPNLKIANMLNSIKRQRQEKEKKDIEKIYKKWEQPKISPKLKNINNIRLYNSESFDKSYDISKNLKNKVKNEIKKKILFDKKVNEDKKKKSFEEKERIKFEEKIKKVEKLKQIQSYSNIIYSSDNIKEIEKKMENELQIIYEKAHLFLDSKNNNMKEKLNYILIIEKYLKKEIIVNKENLITPDKAAFYHNNNVIRLLGYFGSEISLSNIKTFIEINPSKEILRNVTFKILASGLATHKIYKFILDSQKLKKKFEDDANQWFLYLKTIKLRIATTFNISYDDIIYFGHNFSKFEVYILLHKNKVINLESILKNYDIIIIQRTLLSNIILSSNIFDKKYNKDKNEWKTKNFNRGGKRYYPPYGWIGIGLKVSDKYKDNIWIGEENKEGEWAVGYHGVGKGNVFNKVIKIINYNLKEGPGQLYKDQLNVEKNKDKYFFCGEGVYFSPNIDEAEKYAEKTTLGSFSLQFQFVFMTRVNPDKIRSPGGTPVDWILNGNDNEIRPYRLLIKIC